jgi:hypothetical protein
MSQEDQSPATGDARRTVIEDLEPSVQELTEGEAALASGGLVVIRGTWETLATRPANTCTAGNALTGADTDYGND